MSSPKVQFIERVEEELGLTKYEFVVVGSGAAIVHGLKPDFSNEDLDITVSPETFWRIKDKLNFVLLDQYGLYKFTSQTGVIDIMPYEQEVIHFEDANCFSLNIGGYQFLNIQDLFVFYARLSAEFMKKKHVEMLRSTIDLMLKK